MEETNKIDQSIKDKLGEIVGLGRIGIELDIEGQDTSLVFPQLHLIFFHSLSPSEVPAITGICIELGLTYSEEIKEDSDWGGDSVFHSLRYICEAYLANMSEGKTREEFEELLLNVIGNNESDDLWKLYRLVNFRTSLRGKKSVDNLKLNLIRQLEGEKELLRREKERLEHGRELLKSKLNEFNVPGKDIDDLLSEEDLPMQVTNKIRVATRELSLECIAG